MPFTLYDATVAGYLQILPAVIGMLDKAEAHCRENGWADDALTTARLAPDMWDFTKQIRAMVIHSADAVDGALVGEILPGYTDDPADFAALRALVTHAIARLNAITPAAINALVGRDARFAFSKYHFDFTAENYLTSFALPNFYFHTTAAYSVLRMKGVPVGKGNFLGNLRIKELAQ
ncbi:MAG: hypothetical protein RLY97_18 [Pseudomonadota bacterium]